ncbi:hypothetical protein EJ05DRAFT_505633 [Pseudovirgaria hyperparasitica]|uniref:F-box domain-containing protein n=1 Tax=Pseudovirgaria hyperparasitica TaxID=470096 RepID=A0A6A6VUH1_9PEZI|nr:uncharacterized protein EJ05DRAFT_505633 [Pseudovirgaria hyperparasitica]KAF2752897.1 hypothetical protein EJ05DRAFT_505633 [Pseudovirgaria hyperparasitica]
MPNPRSDILSNITSTYLAPFDDFNLDDLPTAIWVRELLCHCCGSLRRLVVDVPFRALYPEDDHLGVRNVLHDAFAQLSSLEEFVCVRDELYLDLNTSLSEPPIWSTWSALRKLALYNVDTESTQFWDSLAGLEHLDTVILTRADSLGSCNPKLAWLTRTHRPIKLIFVNVERDHTYMFKPVWKQQDPKNLVDVMSVDVGTAFYGDESPIELCQDWIKQNAIWGKLWACNAKPMRQPG